MSDGSVTLEMILNDLKFTAGMLRAANSQKQFTSEIDKTKRESAKADKELDRMAEAVKKLTATPLEKFNKELSKLDLLQKKGKISADEHTRAIALQRTQLDMATTSTQKLGTATNKIYSDTFLEMAQSIGLITTGAGAASMAINKIGQALQFAQQQAKEAAGESKSLATSRANLVQISGGDKLKYAELQAEAKQLEEKGIPREQAAQMVFASHSEGWSGELKQVADAHQVIPDTRAAAQVAGQIPGMYRNQGVEIGSLESVNLTMKAAEQSRLDFAPMGTAMVQSAEGATKAGTSPEELAALTGYLAGEYKSGDVAAQRISSFGAEIAKDDRLRGKGHMGAFRALRDDFSAADRDKWLGEDSGRNLFYQSMMTNEGAIEERKSELQAEQVRFRRGEGLIHKQISLTDKDSTFKALKSSQIEVNRLAAVKEEKLSQHGLSVEGGTAKASRQQLEKGASGIERGFARMATDAASFFGAPGNMLPKVSSVAGNATRKHGFGAMAAPALSTFGPMAGPIVAPFEAVANKMMEAAKMMVQGSKHRAMNVEANQQPQ